MTIKKNTQTFNHLFHTVTVLHRTEVPIAEGLFDTLMDRYKIEVISPYFNDDKKYKTFRRIFWLSVKQEYGGEPFYNTLYRKMSRAIDKYISIELLPQTQHPVSMNRFPTASSEKELLQQMKHVRMMGYFPIKRGGKIVRIDHQTKFIQGLSHSHLYSRTEFKEENNFITTIPYSIMGTFDNNTSLMSQLSEINLEN
jgi:hypothetical protein